MDAREVQGGALKIYCVRTRGFEPHTMHKDARVAQWIRRGTSNPKTAGSSPAVGSFLLGIVMAPLLPGKEGVLSDVMDSYVC